MKFKNKKANILTENLIFIILNLVFLSILILFLFNQMGSASVLEEKYSKQIALLIDSAKPGMVIDLNLEDAVKKAKSEKYEGDIVKIIGNIVNVQLDNKGGYSYSFFNDVSVSMQKLNEKEYRFEINGR